MQTEWQTVLTLIRLLSVDPDQTAPLREQSD